jgi:hypothetical protein
MTMCGRLWSSGGRLVVISFSFFFLFLFTKKAKMVG